ncbi:MAG: hypothetical protein C0444_03175 [Microbacterium sp.]|nr:hypothetical protein [Microbacterium sp.]MBA4345626.1 hypothetical protein [Microbacterium sp.]
MNQHIDKSIKTADRLSIAGVVYLILTILGALAFFVAGFARDVGGPDWGFVGAGLGLLVGGWLVQAFASAVAAHIELAAARAHHDLGLSGN